MLTRALFLVLLICGVATPVLAEETKVLALGLADHEVTQEGLDKGTPPVPRFNSPAIAYVSAANLKKGDSVEITLSNADKALLTNSETLADDRADLSAAGGQAGRAGRRLAVGVDLFRQAQDHPRRQDADRAGHDADSVRITDCPGLDFHPLTIHISSIWMEEGHGRRDRSTSRQNG